LNTKIYMLGTGTAVPIKRGLPCIVLKIDSDLYVFDVGEGCQQRMFSMGLGIVKIKSIFITHMHGDHYLGVFGLLQSMHLLGKKNGLTIVAPPELVDVLNHMIELKLTKLTYDHEICVVKEGEVYSDNKLRVYAFPVDHSIPAYGYSILVKGRNQIVYTGDTAPYEKVVEVAEKSELLIHEATFTSRDRREAYEEKHSTAADAALIARKAGVKQLVLTHISPRYSDPYEVFYDAYRYFRNVVVAEDNMVLFL